MIEMTRAELLKHVVGVMVDVDMSLTPPKVIRREVCLQAKIPSRLSKDHGHKKRPNIL